MIAVSACRSWQPDQGPQHCTEAVAPTPRIGTRSYLIVGGYAVGIYAQPRATKDLDIFIGPDTANGELVWAALAKFGAPVADIPPNELAEPYSYFTWGNPPFRVDILTHISGVSFDDAWRRRTVHTVNDATGLTAPFISADDLITNKLAAGRDPERLQDLADAQALRKAAATCREDPTDT